MTSRIDKTIARQREKYVTLPPRLRSNPRTNPNNKSTTPPHTHTLLIVHITRIAAGAYYEAHQQLRVIAARYIKQSNYDAAAELLAGGATALLRAGSQQGASASGGDLAIMLVVEVYNKAEWEIRGGDSDTEGRARKSKFMFY